MGAGSRWTRRGWERPTTSSGRSASIRSPASTRPWPRCSRPGSWRSGPSTSLKRWPRLLELQTRLLALQLVAPADAGPPHRRPAPDLAGGRVGVARGRRASGARRQGAGGGHPAGPRRHAGAGGAGPRAARGDAPDARRGNRRGHRGRRGASLARRHPGGLEGVLRVRRRAVAPVRRERIHAGARAARTVGHRARGPAPRRQPGRAARGHAHRGRRAGGHGPGAGARGPRLPARARSWSPCSCSRCWSPRSSTAGPRSG